MKIRIDVPLCNKGSEYLLRAQSEYRLAPPLHEACNVLLTPVRGWLAQLMNYGMLQLT
jgi:hypothetical protein